MKPKNPDCSRTAMFFAFFLAAQHAMSATADNHDIDRVLNILPGDSGFDGLTMHLPTEKAAFQSGLFVDGLLIGFVGDFVPLTLESHEIRFTQPHEECGQQEFFLTFEVTPDGPVSTEKRLESSCNKLVEWPDPQIIEVDVAGRYWQVVLSKPELEPEFSPIVEPAVIGIPEHLRLTVRSDPPGSEIYINGELLDFATNTRISVPYYQDLDEEKRYLIRQDGLVNCYGAISLPKRDASVDCIHRDMR